MTRLNSQVPPIGSCPSLCMTDLQQLLRNRSENPLINLATHATSTKKALNHFNMRVTQRLHRYRSMKKQWQEVATSKQSTLSILPRDDLLVIQDPMKNGNLSSKRSLVDSKTSCVSDCSQITGVTDPLHSKIRQDLMKLRKIINQNQMKSDDATPFISPNSIRLLGERVSEENMFSCISHSDNMQINIKHRFVFSFSKAYLVNRWYSSQWWFSRARTNLNRSKTIFFFFNQRQKTPSKFYTWSCVTPTVSTFQSLLSIKLLIYSFLSFSSYNRRQFLRHPTIKKIKVAVMWTKKALCHYHH